MSDPNDSFENRQRRDANPTRAADPVQPSWLTDPYATDRYPVPQEPALLSPREPLFSRRVLFGWAFATLVVVFAITVILPMLVPLVRETVIESVVGRMHDRGMNVRINGHPVGPAVPAIPTMPEIPEIPAIPPVPANAAEPAAAPAPAGSEHHKKTIAPAPKARR